MGAEDGDAIQPSYRTNGLCGTIQQKAREQNPDLQAREDAFHCKCLIQECCGSYDKCKEHTSSCNQYGFNCVSSEELVPWNYAENDNCDIDCSAGDDGNIVFSQ